MRHQVWSSGNISTGVLLSQSSQPGSNLTAAVQGLTVGVEVFCRVYAMNPAGKGAAAVAAVTPAIPLLLSAAVLLAAPSTGASLGLTASFATSTALPPGARLLLSLPFGFDAATASLPPTETTWTLAAAQTRLVTLTLSSPLPAGAAVSISIASIINPHIAGAPGVASLETLPPAGAPADPPATSPAPFSILIDATLAIPLAALLPGVLPDVALALADGYTGRVTELSVAFSASARNPIPPGATFRVTFPLELRTGLAGVVVARSSGVDGALVLMVRDGGVVEVSRVGGAEVPAGGRVTVTLGGVHTPRGAVTTGAFDVELLSSEGALIDTVSRPHPP